jgi:SAM-dependent methyltransferase
MTARRAVDLRRATGWLGDRLAGPYRRLFPRQRPDNWDAYGRAVGGKIGLEIGGPSRLWATGHFLPVYALCEYVDGVNFANQSVWEGHIEAGPYRCEGAHGKGRQIIADAVDLRTIADGRYDFVLASHVLEHIANPIKALRHWQRVLKTAGHLVLALPHRDGSLPLSRPVTRMEHLITDWRNDMPETDLTHVDESVEGNSSLKDQASKDENRALLMRNIEHRMMHHHSFDPNLVVALVDHVGLQIRAVDLLDPGSHIVCLAEKPAAGARPDNAAFVRSDAAHLRNPPFAVDRRSGE